MNIKINNELPSLSVAIISRNEEARIARCLESVRPIAREIIVVDSGSSDNTIMIAESFGATVYSEEWQGFVGQRNSVMAKCSCEWILFLDCDEVLSASLCKSIAKAVQDKECNGYKLKYVSFFMGRWIKHVWSQDWHLRLIRRGQAVWVGHDVHETINCKEPVKKLDGDAYHFTYVNNEQHLTKGIYYATLGAKSLCARGKKVKPYMLVINPVWSLVKHYVVKLGFLDGFPGFVISVTSMYHNFYKYWFAWEIQNRESIETPDILTTPPCQPSAEKPLKNRPS